MGKYLLISPAVPARWERQVQLNEIGLDRLARIKSLDIGPHRRLEGFCAMEAVAYIAGEPWSDNPDCVCPIIGAFIRNWNDELPDDDRTRLILPLVPRLVGTRGSSALEERRSLMAADWLVRVHAPAWLRLVKLTTSAEALEALPEIVSMEQVSSICEPLEAAQGALLAERSATSNSAWSDVRNASLAAASDAAWAALNAGATYRAARMFWDARIVSWDAAKAAAGVALKPTVEHLQASVIALIERMLEAKEAA